MKREIAIRSSIGSLKDVEEFIEKVAGEMKIGKETYGKVLVAVMVAVIIAIIHGNRNDPSKTVNVSFDREEDFLITIVSDEGEGFSPDTIPDPTHPANIENVRGRGVFLIRRLADNVEYNRKGNSVKMSFNMIMP
jgi:serine/threonine-protein kinase RsbW